MSVVKEVLLNLRMFVWKDLVARILRGQRQPMLDLLLEIKKPVDQRRAVVLDKEDCWCHQI